MSSGDAGLHALLRYIDGVRDQALAGIRAQADGEARALLRAARGRAREQVRQALREARQDAEARIGLARAQAQARVRAARHALTAAALQRIWPPLEPALRARWQDAPARAAWVALALALAQRHLPDGAWRVAHPPGWDPAEARAACDALRAGRAGVALAFEPTALAAGLRIACGPAELDVTAEGLLRDRARVESLWLAELERTRRERGACAWGPPPPAGAWPRTGT